MWVFVLLDALRTVLGDAFRTLLGRLAWRLIARDIRSTKERP